MHQYRQNNFNESNIAKNIAIANREKSDAKITWAVSLPILAGCVWALIRFFH